MKKELYATQEYDSAVQTESPHGGVKRVLSGILNGFLILLFGLTANMTLLIVFFKTTADALNVQPLFGFSEEKIKAFLTSVLPLLLSLILLLTFLILIILKNRKKTGKLFRSIGLSFGCAGLLGIAAGLFCSAFKRLLPAALRDMLLGEAHALGALLFVSAIAWFILASVLLSVFLVVRCVRRGEQRE